MQIHLSQAYFYLFFSHIFTKSRRCHHIWYFHLLFLRCSLKTCIRKFKHLRWWVPFSFGASLISVGHTPFACFISIAMVASLFSSRKPVSAHWGEVHCYWCAGTGMLIIIIVDSFSQQFNVVDIHQYVKVCSLSLMLRQCLTYCISA